MRRRLLISYVLLIGVSVFLSSLASLLLFGRRAGQEAERDLAAEASTLANVLETLSQSEPLAPPDLLAGLFADARLRASGQQILVLDATGRPLISLAPPPQRPAASGPPSRRGDPFGRIRRPLNLDSVFPPLSPATDGQPATAVLRTMARQPLIYATLPLPENVTPSFEALLPGPSKGTPRHLAIVRPRLNLAGALQGILPSVLLVSTMALLLASLLAVAVAGSITRPVAALTAATVRMAAGDYAARVRPAHDDDLGRLGQAFNQMATQVQEADVRQRDFVANVSHDLRTPLTTVRGFARALVDGTARTEEQRHRAAAAIDAASERMASLVESLLDLARLEGRGVSGSLSLRSQALAPILTATVAAAQGAAQAADIAVSVVCPEDLFVHGDREWLGRALGNVLDNALRFSPRGEPVRIRALRRPAGAATGEPATGDDQAMVEISVEDRGPGIAPQDLPRVFERFYRGDPARQAGGSGLGLAIAKEIVEAHGGRIAIGSSVGQVTRVIISLREADSGAGTPVGDSRG